MQKHDQAVPNEMPRITISYGNMTHLMLPSTLLAAIVDISIHDCFTRITHTHTHTYIYIYINSQNRMQQNNKWIKPNNQIETFPANYPKPSTDHYHSNKGTNQNHQQRPNK